MTGDCISVSVLTQQRLALAQSLPQPVLPCTTRLPHATFSTSHSERNIRHEPVLLGNPGISSYLNSTFEACSTASARPPSPEPQITASLGAWRASGRRERRCECVEVARACWDIVMSCEVAFDTAQKLQETSMLVLLRDVDTVFLRRIAGL